MLQSINEDDSQSEHQTDEQKYIETVSKTISDVVTSEIRTKQISDVTTSEIASFCNKQMGIQREKTAIELYQEKNNVVVSAGGDYVKRLFKEDGLCKWFVGGRVDGVIGRDLIVEIKNRKKGFNPTIPLYEMLQVYTYMYVMDINNAVVVEMFNGNLNETNFTYSDGYETFALQKLKGFCTFMEEFINDETLKTQFLKHSFDVKGDVEHFNQMLLDKLNIRHLKSAKVTPIKNIITTTSQDTTTRNEQHDVSLSSRIPVIVFDVEHTGCSDAYILQLSWGLYNNDGSLIKMRDYYLRPESEIYINPRASFVHGITYDTLLTKPNTLPINELLFEFVNDVLQCDVLVAHNMCGDIKTAHR